VPLPRDFLDEVETELREAQRGLTRDHTRMAALEELHRLTLALTHDLGRALTVFDVIRSADTRGERERRLALVRQLRTDPTAKSQPQAAVMAQESERVNDDVAIECDPGEESRRRRRT
jgi:hypothetical protein